MGGRLNNKADVDEDEDLQLERERSSIIRMGGGDGEERIRRREIAKKGRNPRHHPNSHHRRRRSMFQLVPLFSPSSNKTMILLPIYLGLLSQLGFLAGFAEGNSEIESCVVQTRSASSSSSSSSSVGSSANGLGYYSGSSSSSSVQNNGGSGSASGLSGVGAPGADGISGVRGTNNGFVAGNNNEAAAAAVVDPHSVILCNIRTLHPDLDMENLTSSVVSTSGAGGGGVGGGSSVQSLDTSSITRLKLVCNDVLFFESAVTPGQLRSLSELHELTIDKCKLKHLPSEFLSGLRHLRKLTINTGNSDWAARSLELSPGALHDVAQLKHLHLGFNHMWNLPEGVLCSLGSLSSLNLTNNLFSDINDLGLPGRPVLGSIKNSAQEYDLSSQDSSSSSGGSSACLSELKSLDISSNTIRTLGSRRMENLKRLQELRVQHNWLEEMEDDALYGLVQLKSLNLSSNRLVALPPKLFQPCKLIREIDLRNNSLAALSPGLLENLEHLQILDLSMNSLTSQWITANEFKSLVRLVILNMAHNQLTHLGPSTFQNLYTLQVLDLSHNLISSIADGTFAPMSNLHSLNLSKNRLITISNNMFNGLYVLHKLILDYNEITSIEHGAMKNCTSLQDLGLVGNSLQDVPQALRGLQLLKTLDLGENKIQSLNNESFLGMGQLIGLRMVDNQLEEIPKGMCDPVTRLRVFNVAQNKIFKINSHAFHSCPELKVLRLDSNKLEMIPPTLAPQLPNLLWLNMSENSIRRVDYTQLPQTLEWLDVSHNQLESLGGAWSSSSSSSSNPSASSQTSSGNNGNKNNILINNNNNNLLGGKGNLNGLILPNSGSSSHHQHSPHHAFTDHHNARLRVVDASHNKITILDHHAIPPQIEVLRLSHNHLKKVAPDTFGRSSNLRRVELIGNQLENLPLSALRFPPVPQGKPLPEFFIGGNPLLCNCEMEYLTRINQLSSLRQHPMVLDLDAIVCRLEYSRTVTYVPLPDIKPQDFLCPYKSHCFALCHCCEFDACDCSMQCPGNCTCYHDDTWTANVVNCARSGHFAIPSRLPMDSTEVYLDGNTIPTLKSHTFIGRKNLRILFLNSSGIETISNKSFNGLQSLSVLHLENNALRALHGYEFDHLTRLRELYLNDNKISSIHNATFLPLKSLEILRLDGNRLVMFTVWQLSLNPYLVEVGLARNEWNCECHFLHQLYGWITDNSRKVIDLIELQCVWNTTHKPGPHLIDYNRTCGSSWALMGYENGFDLTTLSPLSLALVFVSLVTLLILVVALVIICRENLSLWLFTRFNGFRLCAIQDYDDDKSYDSYLIYSQKDEEFVAQRIADELETNDNYRLCLHYRDLICEGGDLKEMMIGAVENSKSVLIILSRNFLQGEWSSGEYRSAFHAVLKKSQRGTGLGGRSSSKAPPKKILIVFIEDIPKVEINPDIRSWVRHNKIQIIKWNIHSSDYGKNRRFWNKLKFSLPDPSSHYHSNITSNTTTTSASSGDAHHHHHHGGIMTTLKYQTTMQGDSHLHHPISYSPHNNTIGSNHSSHPHHNNHNHHPHNNHHHHHQIIVDESGKYSTAPTSGIMLPSSHNGTLTNSPKYWPYGPTNFVALPPKYQQSHRSSSSGGSHPPSVNSPGSAQSIHYHPPLPTSNPPKSPPSSQSTDSTTTTMADDAPSLMSQLTMASYNNGPPLISMNINNATKSPVPVPKSSYSSSNSASTRNNILMNSPIVSNSSNSTSAANNGESYLSIDGEHVYSTLDPPSPQPVQQSMSLSQNISSNNSSSANNSTGASNILNNIHLPNGYTYQPQSTLNHHMSPPPSSHNQHQHQWQSNGGGNSSHHFSPSSSNSPANSKQLHQVMSSFASPNSSSSNGSSKGFKLKDGNNPVQTYLV